MGWAAAPMRSFGGLQLGHRLERIDFMAAREGEERFLRRGAVREIGFENARDGARRLVGDDVAIKLAAERRVRAEAAADKDVITLERIVVFVDLDLAGEQPDLGHEMLRAGMMTAGQMNIDRRVEWNARFAPARNLFGMAFGVGGGKFAAGIASAGDEAGTDGIGMDRKAERPDPRLRPRQFFGRNAREQKILPDSKPQIAVAAFARDRGKPV